MIRVLHVLGGLNLGGAETMVMNLYRAIDRTKIQFDFIIHLSEKQAYEDEILRLGGRIFRFPRFTGKNILSQAKIWDAFLKEHPEYTILHSHVRSYASLYLPIAKKNGVKTIIHSHSTSNGSGMSSYIKSAMQYPLRYEADFCFGCSEEAGRWLFGNKVLNSNKYFMLKNAIDLNKYQISVEIRKKYRNEWNIDDSSRVFMHVGRLHEAKNHTFLLDIFNEYQHKHSNSILILAGDGELKDNIRQKIYKLGLATKLKMLGERNDITDLLHAADCLLFPSNWEGLPVTVVEAQAAGLPCLVSDTVTKDVNVTELVKNLPINKGTEVWIREIEKLDFHKKDVSEDIRRAGFDIESSAKWISNFYMRLSEK